MVKRLKTHIGLIIVILLSLPLLMPLVRSGFFTMHDDTQIVRVSQMAKALSSGHIPVRWTADLGYGYGYPLFNFYAPLPYYAGGLASALGLSSLSGTKVMFGLGIIFSGITMYFLCRKLWGKLGGVFSAALYMYAPYHAVDVYIRGAVGEFWALAFIPLVFLGILGIVKDDKKPWKYVIIGSVGYAGVVLSHNITAMLLTGFLLLFVCVYVLYLLIRKKSVHSILYLLSAIFLGLGLSAFFALPALLEMKYTDIGSIIGGSADFRLHFLYIDQLWDSPWGFAGSGPGTADGMSFKIGKLHVLFSLAGLFMLVYLTIKKKLTKSTILVYSYVLFVLVASIFMALDISQFVWELVSPLELTQYPWRFLVFIVFSVSLIGGGVALLPVKKTQLAILIFAATSVVSIVNYKYFTPQTYYSISEQEYTSDSYVKWQVSTISDEYLPKDFAVPEDETGIIQNKFFLEEDGAIEIVEEKTHQYRLNVTTNTPNILTINTAYFPGWKVFVNNHKIIPSTIGGIMHVNVPAGKSNVYVVFSNTLIRTIANIISFASFALFFGTIIYLGVLRKKIYAKDKH